MADRSARRADGDHTLQLSWRDMGDGTFAEKVMPFADGVWAAASKTGINASTYFVLIDLSDIINWPHDSTGFISLSSLYMSVDRAANSSGTLRVGVVRAINSVSATVEYFSRVDFTNASDILIIRDRDFTPSFLSTEVLSGGKRKMISTGYTTDVTGVNTATALDSPLGNATVVPAVGDIIVNFVHNSGGAYNANVATSYISSP